MKPEAKKRGGGGRGLCKRKTEINFSENIFSYDSIQLFFVLMMIHMTYHLLYQ
ncbi:MAG: hypothetical protein AB2693_13570 [Candidatus Thiodiazotropha sp.]